MGVFLNLRRLVLGAVLLCHRVVVYFVFVDFDHSVPTTSNDGIIVTTVAYVADLAFLGVVTVEGQCETPRYDIKYFHITVLTANNELAMLMVKLHASDITGHHIFKGADRFA